jgi:hypothetical protein
LISPGTGSRCAADESAEVSLSSDAQLANAKHSPNAKINLARLLTELKQLKPFSPVRPARDPHTRQYAPHPWCDP